MIVQEVEAFKEKTKQMEHQAVEEAMRGSAGILNDSNSRSQN